MSVTHFTIFLMSFPTDEAYLRKLIQDLHQVCHAIEEQWAQQAEEDHQEEEHEEEEDHPEEEEEEEEEKQPPKQEVPRANRSLPFPCLLIKTGQRKFYHKFYNDFRKEWSLAIEMLQNIESVGTILDTATIRKCLTTRAKTRGKLLENLNMSRQILDGFSPDLEDLSAATISALKRKIRILIHIVLAAIEDYGA